MSFTLHPRLAQDSLPVADLPLCQVRLMNDARFPWLLLVPRRDGLRELHQLDAGERVRLIEEIALVSRVLELVYRPDKLNIGALGNLVPQLHVHVVARFQSDAAWPGPVWGSGAAHPYPAERLAQTLERLRQRCTGQS
ncbi:MAG TPA: HIT family protein [Candidatus Competibacteraceae bacterium]|nr:HIT family protein [Candidatus Competibacteraceae bacterium]